MGPHPSSWSLCPVHPGSLLLGVASGGWRGGRGCAVSSPVIGAVGGQGCGWAGLWDVPSCHWSCGWAGLWVSPPAVGPLTVATPP